MVFKVWEYIKNAVSLLGVLLASALGVFLLGKSSVPTKLTIDEIKKAKDAVRDEQSKMDVFDKLDSLDNSINKL